jgi:hypothetical protein
MAGSLPPEALAAALQAVHKTGVATDPNAAPGGAGGAGPSQDPSQGDPIAQGGGDPQQAAVWAAFPSTDPSQIPQGGDEGALTAWLGQYMQQRESDLDQFTQQQDAVLAQAFQSIGGPVDQGQDTGGAAPQSPGVGGQGAGY